MSNYTEEFNRVSTVARLGNADAVRVSYAVFCGDPNNDDEGFLGTGFFSADDFTTWNDAAKARLLVSTVLGHVDEHQKNNTANNTANELPNNLRHELARCIENTVDTMLEYRDDKHFRAMLITEIICNLNDILAKNNLR